MTNPPDTAIVPYRDPSLSIIDRVADLLARMTIDEKLAQLGSVWVFQIATDTWIRCRSGRRRCSADGIGHDHADEWRQRASARRGGGGSANASNGTCSRHPARHPGDRPRGDLFGPDGSRGHRVPAGARRGGHVPARAQPRLADAVRRQMRAIGAHQGLSPVLDVVPRPALGPARGDVRRGPVSSCRRWASPSSAGCRGATTAATSVTAWSPPPSTSSATARRRAGMNWAPAHLPRARAARRVPAAVRGGGARRRAGLGDERLPGDRRHRRARRTVGC